MADMHFNVGDMRKHLTALEHWISDVRQRLHGLPDHIVIPIPPLPKDPGTVQASCQPQGPIGNKIGNK